MFTIKAIKHEGESETEVVHQADYYEVRKSGATYPTLSGYMADGAVVCRHSIFEDSPYIGVPDRCDVVYVTNFHGQTIDKIAAQAPAKSVEGGKVEMVTDG